MSEEKNHSDTFLDELAKYYNFLVTTEIKIFGIPIYKNVKKYIPEKKK